MEAAGRLRVLHLIPSLGTGGAEMMLTKLLSTLNPSTIQSEVISLTDLGPVATKIAALGIPVRPLGMRRGVPNPLYMGRLASWIREFKPNVIQTWMYHADLMGGLAAKWIGGIPVLWNLRQSHFDRTTTKLSTMMTIHTCARLSAVLPTRIVACSEASRTAHTEVGYAAAKMVVIPNGFDLERYSSDHSARDSVRNELGIPADAALVGLVARFHQQKDHRTFVHAAAQLVRQCPNVHFLLCGDDITWQNPELKGWIDQVVGRDNFHLLGPREDVPRITAALDIAALSSVSEGFPNVVGEAMACGVPCVVTDVGDAALIVGDTGSVVPPSNPEAMARAWRDLLADPRRRINLGNAARRRVEQNYSLPVIASRYEALYEEVGRHVRDYRLASQAP